MTFVNTANPYRPPNPTMINTSPNPSEYDPNYEPEPFLYDQQGHKTKNPHILMTYGGKNITRARMPSLLSKLDKDEAATATRAYTKNKMPSDEWTPNMWLLYEQFVNTKELKVTARDKFAAEQTRYENMDSIGYETIHEFSTNQTARMEELKGNPSLAKKIKKNDIIKYMAGRPKSGIWKSLADDVGLKYEETSMIGGLVTGDSKTVYGAITSDEILGDELNSYLSTEVTDAVGALTKWEGGAGMWLSGATGRSRSGEDYGKTIGDNYNRTNKLYSTVKNASSGNMLSTIWGLFGIGAQFVSDIDATSKERGGGGLLQGKNDRDVGGWRSNVNSMVTDYYNSPSWVGNALSAIDFSANQSTQDGGWNAQQTKDFALSQAESLTVQQLSEELEMPWLSTAWGMYNTGSGFYNKSTGNNKNRSGKDTAFNDSNVFSGDYT